VVGTLLDGKYRIDRVVAEGGFGVVYAGFHIRLEVPVAVKFLKPPLDDARGKLVASFLAEARLTAKLRHPNIAQVLDTGVLHSEEFAEGIPWTTFEWLDGETLAEFLKRRRGLGGLAPTEAWKLLSPIVNAIATAHASGIVHRDLKPSNVMLVPEGGGISPRVLDFGIAKSVGDPLAESSPDTTRSSVVAFSPAYAAPEQVARSRTGFWTDVHALGLICTEVLTGRRAYLAEHGTELLVNIVAAERPTPGRHGVDVGAWETVLARALAVEPRERYANAGELSKALEEALEDTNFSSTRPRARQGRESKKRRVALAFVALGTLAAIVSFARREPEEAPANAAAVDREVPRVEPVTSSSPTASRNAPPRYSTNVVVEKSMPARSIRPRAVSSAPKASSSASAFDTWP
jgi:serine/threonine protein kinase